MREVSISANEFCDRFQCSKERSDIDFSFISIGEYPWLFCGLMKMAHKKCKSLRFSVDHMATRSGRSPTRELSNSIATKKPKFTHYLVTILCHKLPKPDCGVQSVAFSGLAIPDDYFRNLILALSESPRLTTVEFENITISEPNAILLFETVSPFRLVRLSVQSCDLQESEPLARAIATFLALDDRHGRPWQLRDFDISGNAFSEARLTQYRHAVARHQEVNERPSQRGVTRGHDAGTRPPSSRSRTPESQEKMRSPSAKSPPKAPARSPQRKAAPALPQLASSTPIRAAEQDSSADEEDTVDKVPPKLQSKTVPSPTQHASPGRSTHAPSSEGGSAEGESPPKPQTPWRAKAGSTSKRPPKAASPIADEEEPPPKPGTPQSSTAPSAQSNSSPKPAPPLDDVAFRKDEHQSANSSGKRSPPAASEDDGYDRGTSPNEGSDGQSPRGDPGRQKASSKQYEYYSSSYDVT
jgi:hypothetical protein